MDKYQKLFEPVVIRGKRVRNRFEAAPVSMGPVKKGERLVEQVLSELDCYTSGGYGIYTIGEVFVCEEGNRREPIDPYDFRDYSPENLLPYQTAAEMVKKKGCLAMIEISHCGFRKRGISYGPMEIWHEDGSHTIAMDERKIDEVCEAFAEAALFMKKAGFDGVMGHFGHGWLVQQFFSPLTNQRTDRFGGSIENRARLAVMILERIRQKTGEDFILEARLSGEELVSGGYGIQEFLAFARILDPLVDILHISMGLYGNPVMTREFSGMYHEKGCNGYLAEALKQVVRHAKVSVVGGVNDPDTALTMIEKGKTDFVALGRQKFADPEFVTKLAAGKPELIYPCLRCFCCFSGPMNKEEAREWTPGCSVNPLHMRYEYMDMPMPEEKKQVLVVGGGIAGLYFSAVASKRGHSVTLIEKTSRLGGILNVTGPDVHKEAFFRYLRALEANVRENGTDLRLNTLMTESLLQELQPEVVVLAAGARPKQVDIPAEEGAVLVMQAVGAMERILEIGNKVVILGGGMIGCELAVFLRERGHQVTVAARGEFLKHVYPLHGKAVSLELEKGVTLLPGYSPVKLTPKGVLVRDREGGEKLLEADTVIEAFGLEADKALGGFLEEMVKRVCTKAELVTIGDFKQPRRIKEAVSEAFLLAMGLGTKYHPRKQESHWI